MEMPGIEQLMRNNTLNMEVMTLSLTLTLTVTLMGDDGHGPGHGTSRMCPLHHTRRIHTDPYRSVYTDPYSDFPLHHTRRIPESTFPWPWDPYAEYI